MLVQYVKMMTKNIYPCRLQANAQWHTSYFTYQYSRKYYPGWDISIAENKMTNNYIPRETQNKMHLYPIVSNMQLTVTGIFEIEPSY